MQPGRGGNVPQNGHLSFDRNLRNAYNTVGLTFIFSGQGTCKSYSFQIGIEGSDLERPPGLAIKYCVRLMEKAGVTRAPVFDGKEIIGILSFTDVFNNAALGTAAKRRGAA